MANENGTLQIELNGKTFVAPAQKARMVRKAIELTDKIDFSNMKPEGLDTLVQYMVDLYGGQFSIDDVYDGLNANKLIPTLMDCLTNVVGEMGAKLNKIPNGQTGA